MQIYASSYLPNGELLLFYKAGPRPQTWSGYLKRSFDEGATWSEEEPLPAGVFGAVKNKPLLLSDGTLLCGSSTESYRRWSCWMDLTTDGGKTWTKSTPIVVPTHPYGIIQPTIFLTKKGDVKMLARSRNFGRICTAKSSDGGKSWSDATPTTLPNPDSGIDAVRMHNGKILLVYNHSEEERYPLNLALSDDDGETWKQVLTLESTPGEYSYPALIQARDGKVHITYTWNRKSIKYVVIDPSQFEKSPSAS